MYKRFGVPVFLALLCFTSNTRATSYEFISSLSSDVLATLETDGTDPFDHTNIVGITFSPASEDLAGCLPGKTFGAEVFVFSSGMWTSDSNGLMGITEGMTHIISENFVDPPSGFTLVASSEVGRDSLETSCGLNRTGADGDWRLVPEPSTATLAILALAAVTRQRRRTLGT